MTETFGKWFKSANKIQHELRLLVKNGIKYNVALTSTIRPKKRKFKAINAKKWQVKNLFLHDFDIVGKTLIEKLIKDDSKEQESYDRAFAMSKDVNYNLLLTDKQYKEFCRFLKTEQIKLKQTFFIQRKGIGLKTIMRFTLT